MVVPVVLAALAIGVSNHFSPPIRIGTHLVASPAAIPPGAAPVPVLEASTEVAEVPAGEALAALSSPPQLTARDTADADIAARDADFLPRTRACSTGEVATFEINAAPVAPEAFGASLAAAAEAQISNFVVYNDHYYNLRYPGGDVPSLYGVCSDVVIRAYRALGIDLQLLVHEARVGSGDRSIDHRRTETLRRFFTRHGTRLPVSDHAEDYLPGDVVSYDRPQNRGGQAHIAIVSSQTGPSGRLMIVHNRGWGPQIEDALFVDQLTGHYRMGSQLRLFTSWGNSQKGASGLESWATLVRRAAIVRRAERPAKSKTTPRL